jgi:hypothetical protein
VRIRTIGSLLIVSVLLLSTHLGMGEEAATGHYIPGAMSDFIDMLPDRDSSSFLYANGFTYYHGSANPSKTLEFGGLLTSDAKATIYADTSLFMYQVPWKFLEGQYAVQLLVPYVWLDVQGDVSREGKIKSQTARLNDAANSFGDIEMFPFMYGWKYGDFKWQTQFGIYVPSGGFDKGDLANIGRNYWTFEPALAVSYLSSKIGAEFTTFVGFDFNTKNQATDYQTGDQFHADGTIAQHLPLFGGFVGAGVNGYFYQQIRGDSGGGAKLGGFEAMTTSVGPVVSYAYKFADFDVAGEAKWLPELDVTNRLNGNTIWVKFGISWGAKPSSPIEAM